MRLGHTDIYVSKSHDGTYGFGSRTEGYNWQKAVGTTAILIEALYKKVLRRELSDAEIVSQFRSAMAGVASSSSESADAPQVPQVDLRALAQKIMDFFSEFHFEPNFRFMNTLAFFTKKSEMTTYIANYFKLTDSPFTSSVIEKMKSSEFNEIVKDLQLVNPSKRINQRFELYYGSQGTGKTTKAMAYASKCMVCHSAMLPQDLMEDFDFSDGKAEFRPSTLYKAMVDGTVIVLDEINLLPFESLRFLQSILDGKEEITYKGQSVKIADGFKIIGTMNLVVNGAVFSLPEPLIDRAQVLKEFVLSANDLVGAFA